MYFADTYRHIGSIDVTPLRAAVEALSDDEWNQSAARQQTYAVHARTRFIPLIYDDDLRHADPTRRPMMDRFASALAPAMDCIRAFFAPVHSTVGTPIDKGYFSRVVLVNLAAGGEIASHTDAVPSLKRAHRVHLPIVTNDQVMFAVRGDIRHLAPGELWEINNRLPHAVRNPGADRIHAILDYVIPGEVIHDPDGVVVA